MAKINEIKNEIIGNVYSMTELENIMKGFGYDLVEYETDDGMIIKFTNYKSQLWMDYISDENQSCIVSNIRVIARIESEPTRVEPFRSYEDLALVLDYFKNNQQYNHWFVACMMVSLGRRVGDTVALKWSDFYTKNGAMRERLTQLEEEKTGKKLGVRINALAKAYIEEYQAITDVNPMGEYNQPIIKNTSAAFRKALKIALSSVGLTYPLSTHSFRKYYANTIYKLHPQDVDRLDIVQAILGHSDKETTKIYINEIDRKIDQYNEDYAGYMLDRGNGIVPDISNSPIVSLKAEDLREILSFVYDKAISSDKFKVINDALKLAEKSMLS